MVVLVVVVVVNYYNMYDVGGKTSHTAARW